MSVLDIYDISVNTQNYPVAPLSERYLRDGLLPINHRNIYRGKELLSVADGYSNSYVMSQMRNKILAGFDDVFIGDEFTVYGPSTRFTATETFSSTSVTDSMSASVLITMRIVSLFYSQMDGACHAIIMPKYIMPVLNDAAGVGTSSTYYNFDSGFPCSSSYILYSSGTNFINFMTHINGSWDITDYLYADTSYSIHMVPLNVQTGVGNIPKGTSSGGRTSTATNKYISWPYWRLPNEQQLFGQQIHGTVGQYDNFMNKNDGELQFDLFRLNPQALRMDYDPLQRGITWKTSGNYASAEQGRGIMMATRTNSATFAQSVFWDSDRTSGLTNATSTYIKDVNTLHYFCVCPYAVL